MSPRVGRVSVRAVFWSEDDARAVAARLRRDSFEARVGRQPFAGEDDDEDHPWGVTTDAPDIMLELLAEEYDGWVDDEASERPAAPVPLSLPTTPIRSRRSP